MLDYHFRWKEGVDGDKFDIRELTQLYGTREFVLPNVRIALVQYVARRADILEKKRLQFLINVMRDEHDLKVVAYAGNEFKTLAHIDVRPTDTAFFFQWWKENEPKLP
jgi:hypothetical protein